MVSARFQSLSPAPASTKRVRGCASRTWRAAATRKRCPLLGAWRAGTTTIDSSSAIPSCAPARLTLRGPQVELLKVDAIVDGDDAGRADPILAGQPAGVLVQGTRDDHRGVTTGEAEEEAGPRSEERRQRNGGGRGRLLLDAHNRRRAAERQQEHGAEAAGRVVGVEVHDVGLAGQAAHGRRRARQAGPAARAQAARRARGRTAAPRRRASLPPRGPRP